jgi:hypothetical protein
MTLIGPQFASEIANQAILDSRYRPLATRVLSHLPIDHLDRIGGSLRGGNDKKLAKLVDGDVSVLTKLAIMNEASPVGGALSHVPRHHRPFDPNRVELLALLPGDRLLDGGFPTIMLTASHRELYALLLGLTAFAEHGIGREDAVSIRSKRAPKNAVFAMLEVACRRRILNYRIQPFRRLESEGIRDLTTLGEIIAEGECQANCLAFAGPEWLLPIALGQRRVFRVEVDDLRATAHADLVDGNFRLAYAEAWGNTPLNLEERRRTKTIIREVLNGR